MSEVFLSLQGEGPSAGTPAHFVRLQGCGVGCTWCDSKYTWDPAGGDDSDVASALAAARALGEAPMIVLTGGEPLEHSNVVALIEAALDGWSRVEIETSGLAPPPLRHDRLFYNVSPKLPSATARWAETWRHVAAFAADPRATFKLVVGDAPDPDEALRLVAEHALPRARVLLMPEGLTEATLRVRGPALAALCVREGLRLSPRLHVWLWGARRGV